MEKFLEKHAANVDGALSCFDRVVFKGYLPLSWPGAMERFIAAQGLLIKDFKAFVPRQAERIVEHAKAFAKAAGRDYRHLRGPTRKEELAHDIAKRDGIEEGLVCVLSAVERCRSFRIVGGLGRPKIQPDTRTCLCLYFYFQHADLGFLSVRIQSWFPFTIQICINGHEWLARQLDRVGMKFVKQDNALVWLEDVVKAQRIADTFVHLNWPRVLWRLAKLVNPLLRDLLRGMRYYWVIDQSEFSTDILFRDAQSLHDLYEELLKHATQCFGADDVMTFLGRRLHGSFEGEVVSDLKKRWPGARIKHRIKQNWIKMYDKHGRLLRVETVINRPYEFKVRRRGIRKGEEIVDWFPLPKGVAHIFRFAEVAMAANKRYLDALAVVTDPRKARDQLRSLARRQFLHDRCYRGFNPAAEEDVNLFAAILRGEHAISGFRNADVRSRLFEPSRDTGERRRQAGRVSRLFKPMLLN
jgi:hypothetical protein